MIHARELLAQFLNASPALVSDQAVARFEDWLHAHDVEVRQDELQRAIEARPEPEGRLQRVVRLLAHTPALYSRQSVESWLELRRAYVPERESRQAVQAS